MSDAQWVPFINPATGEQFGAIRASTPAEIREARAAMGRRAPQWRATPLRQRIQLLKKLQAVILDNVDYCTDVIGRDTGKSRQDALIEVFMTVNKLQEYCKRAPKWLKPQRVPPGLFPFKRYYAEPQPVGTVAVIGPWNYPFDLAMPPLMAALLAGNTVLLKPSEVTPAVGELIEQLISSVPELALNVRVLHGGGEVGAALVDAHPDLVFFTGAVRTARLIGRETAEHLIPFLYELGGKDPMLVLEDADIDAAAEWGCWSAFFNAGQSCVCVERTYVHQEVYDRFVEAVLAWTAALKVGYTPELESPFHYGPMTDARQLAIVQAHLDDAVKKGARIIAGGGMRGSYIEPTVVVDVDHTMDLMTEETFGPVLPIMKVADEAEAIRLANETTYGLGASIWSRDLQRARRVADEMETGSVIINDTMAHYAIPLLPFGGVKQSGNARTHGASEVLQFTHMRAYAVGQPPPAFDLATIMRRPGHYWLGAAMLKGVFGVTLRQRLDALDRVVGHFRGAEEGSVGTDEAAAPAPAGQSGRNGRVLAAAGSVAIAAGAVLLALRREKKPE
jgi:acyl-CoA reductase-like NAD-dependent aldehyde dehydrogenase